MVREHAHAAHGSRLVGRKLFFDWEEIDFDDFSLTFLDMQIAHEPVDWEWYLDKAFMTRLGNTLRPDQVRAEDYVAIYFDTNHVANQRLSCNKAHVQ